jgi:hypothetical protein
VERLAGLLVGDPNEVMYIHCHGGHGRTGTIAALLLGRLYGLGASAALELYQHLHDTREQPVFRGDPPMLRQVLGSLELGTEPPTPSRGSVGAFFLPQVAQVYRLLGSTGMSLGRLIRECREAQRAGDVSRCGAAAERAISRCPRSRK